MALGERWVRGKGGAQREEKGKLGFLLSLSLSAYLDVLYGVGRHPLLAGL